MQPAYNEIVWQNYTSIETPLNATNLNSMSHALKTVDNRVVSADTTKANQSDLLQTLKTVTYNTQTGLFTFTWWNGNTFTVDLNIEKIPVSFSMSPQGVITMTTSDGTTYTADVSSLIKTYSFVDSSTIVVTVTTDSSGNKTVTSNVKDGSITESKLQPNFLADCRAEVNAAHGYATNASNSADSASASKLVSEGFANGTQNGTPVTSESPYYENNAKYWKEQAQAIAGGGVTSVGMTVPTGLQVSGSPITSSGTLAVSLASGYSIPTTTKQTQWDSAYTATNGATNANTGNKIVKRDSSGNFSAGTITANLTGTATRATADASGNNIANTYKTKSESANVVISTTAPSDTTALWINPSA